MSESSLRNRWSKAGDGKETPTPPASVEINEKIISEVYAMYSCKNQGLCKIGKSIDVPVRPPRRKITILLLGNHSAGKSSFINWYIEQPVLKTGIAIETQGFSFVTSGKKRDTLKGLATLQLYPHLKPLENYPGVLDYLTTEISTSVSNKFNLVTFVDTPGLVDGDMHYPFDVNETLLWLGEMVDLVFVFFDPMGQALCKRTLNIVERMWARYSDKIRLYLAKSDEAGTEKDRQKVLMQIVQELCKRPGLNRSGFDMPTFYLPGISRETQCANQLDEVCDEISKCIDQSVQNSLNNLESDCERIKERVNVLLTLDSGARDRNFKRRIRSTLLSSVGVLLPIFIFATLLVANSTKEAMARHLGESPTTYLLNFMLPVSSLWLLIPASYHLEFIIFIVMISFAFLFVARFNPPEPVLPARDFKNLKASSKIMESLIEKKQKMYSMYLNQSVHDEEFTDVK